MISRERTIISPGNAVISLDGVSRFFGPVRAVEDVSLRVGQGELYGFLGLNGADKTTTIRALLGMVRPSAGTVRLFDVPVGPNGRGPWSRVGYLVGRPAGYPDLTVRENLEIARRLHLVADADAVLRVANLLGLGPLLERRAGTLSTGNLQRLGLARALLHKPDLLVLDEPTDALDPAGVVEIRDLLAGLAGKGVTIFMSSHILSEVERLATRIGIIHQGRLIEEVDAQRLAGLREQRLVVAARDSALAQQTLERAGYAVACDDKALVLREARALEAPEAIAALLVAAGAPPTRLAIERETLEAHFLRMTGAIE